MNDFSISRPKLGLIFCLWGLLANGFAFGQKLKPIELLEFTQSTCDKNTDVGRLNNRISSFNLKGDTLQIEIAFAAQCCVQYVPEIKYFKDTLSFQIKRRDENDDGCMCTCCYSVNHKLKGVTSDSLTVLFKNKKITLSGEKYKTYPVTFEVVRGDTVNLKDKYGFRQGIWFYKDGKFNRYKDDKSVASGRISESGQILEIHTIANNHYREYYENGNLKKECYFHVNEQMGNCKEWMLDGRLK